MKLDKRRLLSKQILLILKEKLNKGKQVLILINRKYDCHYVLIVALKKCEKCDIN